ncbi:Leucine-responsive regulatory protein [compost metagenome]
MLDAYEVRIIEALQEDGRLSVQEVSGRIGLSTTPTWKRLKGLEQNGIISKYTAVIDRLSVGLHSCVLAEVNLARHEQHIVEAFELAVMNCPAIVECHGTTGHADYMLKILTPDISKYHDFLQSIIFKLPGVTGIKSSVVLKEIKSITTVPLNHLY